MSTHPASPRWSRYVLVLVLEVAPVMLVLAVGASLALPHIADRHRNINSSPNADNPAIGELHSRRFGTDPSELVAAASSLWAVRQGTEARNLERAARRLVLQDLLGEKPAAAGTLRALSEREEKGDRERDELYGRLRALFVARLSPPGVGEAVEWKLDHVEMYRHVRGAVWADANRAGRVRIELTNRSKRAIRDIVLWYPIAGRRFELFCDSDDARPADWYLHRPWLAGETIRLMCAAKPTEDAPALQQSLQGLESLELLPRVGSLRLDDPPVGMSGDTSSFPEAWKPKWDPMMQYDENGWIARLGARAREVVNGGDHAVRSYPWTSTFLAGVTLGLVACAIARRIWARASSFRLAGAWLSWLAIVPFAALVFFLVRGTGSYAFYAAAIVATFAALGYVGWLVGFWLHAMALGPSQPRPEGQTS
jgi:hypothetical protein